MFVAGPRVTTSPRHKTSFCIGAKVPKGGFGKAFAMSRPKLVILGAGPGGLAVAKSMIGVPVDVSIVEQYVPSLHKSVYLSWTLLFSRSLFGNERKDAQH